jgi:hypothetical protein
MERSEDQPKHTEYFETKPPAINTTLHRLPPDYYASKDIPADPEDEGGIGPEQTFSGDS